MTRLNGLIPSALFFLASFLGAARDRQAGEQPPNVKRVYVDSLGEKSDAEELRNSLISQLKKSKIVTVVASREQADAVLKGNGELWIRGYHSLNPRSGILPQNGTPILGGYLSVELQGQDRQPLWSHIVTARSGSTHVTKDLCKELVKEFSKALLDANLIQSQPAPVQPHTQGSDPRPLAPS